MPHRIQWLDIAKGITILLMVIGHTSIPQFVSNFIWAFHMPLFFIASGFITDWNKDSFLAFCSRKLTTLGIPFVIYSIIVLAVELLIGENTFIHWITKGWEGYALWFIPILFFALIFTKALFLVRQNVYRNCCILTFLAIGYLLSFFKIELPWTLSSIPYAFCMVVFGNEFKKYSNIIENPSYLCLLFLFAITLTISYSWRLDMCFNNIIPISFLTVGALAGSLFVFMTSSFIALQIKPLAAFLSFIGKETFIFVAFSQIVIILLNYYFTFNAGVKYLLLFVILLILKYIKDGVNMIFQRKVL